NFLFLPRTRIPPAYGLVLTRWPAKALTTARRAASASPVVEGTRATSATTIAGEGRRRLMVLAWGRVPGWPGARRADRRESTPGQWRAPHPGLNSRASP